LWLLALELYKLIHFHLEIIDIKGGKHYLITKHNMIAFGKEIKTEEIWGIIFGTIFLGIIIIGVIYQSGKPISDIQLLNSCQNQLVQLQSQLDYKNNSNLYESNP